jgi:hypothetical protein
VLGVEEGVEDDEQSMTTASEGFVSSERKALVVIGVVDDEALNAWCNH